MSSISRIILWPIASDSNVFSKAKEEKKGNPYRTKARSRQLINAVNS